MNGNAIIAAAEQKLGQKYVFGARVPLDDKNWTGPWDCAEYTSWAIYQVCSRVYGCTNNNLSPKKADAWTGSWKRDALSIGIRIDKNVARFIPGAMLLQRGATSGHIVISDGSGNGSLEARGRNYGVVRHVVNGRPWDMGILVPGIEYENPNEESLISNEASPIEEPVVFRTLKKGFQTSEGIAATQEALTKLGFFDGAVNSVFDVMTEIAVRDFQISAGLTPNGIVDSETSSELGVNLNSQIEIQD